MKTAILEILHCPRCTAPLTLTPLEEDAREVRRGRLSCSTGHRFEVEDGIIRFATGFDHDAVKKELEYENSTYCGSDRLTDPKIIAHFPETLADLWPHTCHFGPDFKVLIESLKLDPNARVLDIGTGPCWSSRLLAQRGARVVALDVNEADYYGLKTSDILFEQHGIFFERILESMAHLPFRNETFDAITFNASFHHTPDMLRTLRECRRVLKPDGIIAMVNEEFVSVRQRLMPETDVTDLGSHHEIPYREFEDSCRMTGFRPDYFVAHHIREKFGSMFPRPLARAAVWFLETCPFALKQLKSALILLRKTPPATQA